VAPLHAATMGDIHSLASDRSTCTQLEPRTNKNASDGFAGVICRISNWINR
jgi:hypothetical protein